MMDHLMAEKYRKIIKTAKWDTSLQKKLKKEVCAKNSKNGEFRL